MEFQPQHPDFTTPPKPSEEPENAAPEIPIPPETQPEEAAASPNFVPGLDLWMNSSTLVGDPLDSASGEGQTNFSASLESPNPDQAIPTDQLILESGHETY